MTTHACPEAVMADVGSQVGVIIQCGRDGGHEGDHVGITDRGIAEWPRIEPVAPLADWERQLLRPCGTCGCTELTHGAYEGDSGCRANECECAAFEPIETPF